MNIRCPNCQTVFRVDPARIPAKGIRARCARCGETFHVQPPAEGVSAVAPAAAQAPAAPQPVATPPSAEVQPREQPVAAAPAAAPATSPAPAAAPTPHTFGSRDPNARAQRIARALVSDIIAYHPKRWETARENGTLRAEFRDEIMKSWEEYVAQVGLDLAKSTPHFRAALNDILARGQHVF